MIKGDGEREVWIIEQVPKGTLQQEPGALVWAQNHQHSQLGTEILTQAWKSGLHQQHHGDVGQPQPALSQTHRCGFAHQGRGRVCEVPDGRRQLWAAESRRVLVSPEEKSIL